MGRWRDGHTTLGVAPATGDGTPGGGAESPGGGGTPGGGAGAVRGPGVPLEIAASYRARTRGLLGRDGIEGAMLLSPANSVHTFRMRFPIDVAYLDRKLRVIAVRTMRPGRLGLPRPRARHVLEAEAGALSRWGVRRGVRLVVGGAVDGARG